MGNCGSAPKTKGDEDAAILAPEVSKEESLKAGTEEAAKVEQEEKTVTTEGANVDAEKKDSDETSELKPVDDNNQPSLGALLTETKETEEKVEDEMKAKEPSEEKEQKEPEAEQRVGNTEPEKVSEAEPAAITQ